MIREHKNIPVFPVRVVASSFDAGVLLESCDLQIGLSETHLVNMNAGDYVLLDLGRELAGGVRVLSYGGGKIRVRVGESAGEASAELGERGACNDHSVRDFTADVPAFSDNLYLQSAFRFIRIDAVAPVLIKAVLAMEERAELDCKGYFRSDDERVNRIFDVAAETLHMCVRDYIWDGVKRDRLVWIGDMHPETLGITCLYADEKSVARSLDYVREHTPLPAWMNRIATYSLWWLIILQDYYFATGDMAFLARQKDYVEGLVDLLLSRTQEDGTFAFDGDMLFDWPTHDTEDEIVGIVALYRLAADKALSLCAPLGLPEDKCRELIARLSRRPVERCKAKQCTAMQVYAGQLTAAEAHESLVAGGAKGLSTFMSYYILSAIAGEGDTAEATAVMKDYYGGMLDLGATTFWEDFDVDWAKGSAPLDRLPKEGEKDIHGDFGAFCYVGFRHSFCHGWSCGPVPYLMHKVAGIRPLSPGAKRVEVKPRLGELNSVSAGYPTPYGVVRVEAKRVGGKVEVKIDAPDGVEIVTD